MRNTAKTRVRKMRSISVTQARKDLGDIFGEVNYNKERIVLTNHKKQVAIVPIEDLKKLQALEDAEDLREARISLKEIEEKGTITLEDMKKRLE